MHFALTDEQQLIQESARTFLAERAGLERLRAVIDSGVGLDSKLWSGLGELGLVGLMVPEVYGGSSLGAVEMALVLEETGRRLAVAPFFETAVLAAQTILLAGTETQKHTLLPTLCTGLTRATLAMTGPMGEPFPQGVSIDLRRAGSGWQLNGEAGFVTFAHVADLLLVVTRATGSTGVDGLSVVAIPSSTAGVSITRLPTLDPTRPYSRVALDNVRVSELEILGAAETAGPALIRVLAIAAGLLASEQTGGAEFCLTSTVEYAKQRVQFGRVIGSFQAIKHELADMMVAVEAARSAALYAAAAIDQDGDELLEAGSVARVWCTEAYRKCAAEAIQLQGGIGFTWEHAAHLYFKRARSSSTWLGEPALHRERIAQLIGLDQETP